MQRGQETRQGTIRMVAYYRVSTTDKQGRSGLGLEAQQAAVRAFLDGKGWPPPAEFVEVESGKCMDWPELAKAMVACRLYGATLVIAKLDRLSRRPLAGGAGAARARPGRVMEPYGDRGRAGGLVGWLRPGRATPTPVSSAGVPLRPPLSAAGDATPSALPTNGRGRVRPCWPDRGSGGATPRRRPWGAGRRAR
jgi:hypothetical protein